MGWGRGCLVYTQLVLESTPRLFLKHSFNEEAAACGLTLKPQVSVTRVECGGKGMASNSNRKALVMPLIVGLVHHVTKVSMTHLSTCGG